MNRQLNKPVTVWILLFPLFTLGQTLEKKEPFPVQAQFAEGMPIRSVLILLEKNGETILADSTETDAFYQAFQLRPGSVFRQSFADKAINRINQLDYVSNATYGLYNANYGDPLVMVVRVHFLKPGQHKVLGGKKGMLKSGSWKDFPLLYESDNTQVTMILNGGTGVYNEVNALFSKGAEFTKGNPIATEPAGKGVTFWGEAYLEPGIAAITRLGKSPVYAYGSMSALISGRNTTDIYSAGPTVFAAFERLYAGVLIAGLGKSKQTNIDLSGGRQFFQLNDGFLFSKFSGSSNAGERGSVYLNSRTTFQKTFIARSQILNWHLQAFFLEPQELFKERQSNTSYSGASVMYNNNKLLDLGISYIQVSGGTSQYGTPFGNINKKGMYVVNPKVWLNNISGTGLFLKSEYAFQAHHNEDMRSNAWYIGLGMKKDKWKYRPSLYYRYAYMQGDDSTSRRFEKFDPMLTGGLGNWVQGINFRKVSGNGNIISHRIELKANLSKSFEASLDYFFLKADTRSNIGALSPISKLNGDVYGQEITLTTRYFLSSHFMFLGIFSYSNPGNALRNAFPDKIYPWTSVQGSLFMFF